MTDQIDEMDEAYIKCERTGEEYESFDDFMDARQELEREEGINAVDDVLTDEHGFGVDELVEPFDETPIEFAEEAIRSSELDFAISETDAREVAGLMLELAGERKKNRVQS